MWSPYEYDGANAANIHRSQTLQSLEHSSWKGYQQAVQSDCSSGRNVEDFPPWEGYLHATESDDSSLKNVEDYSSRKGYEQFTRSDGLSEKNEQKTKKKSDQNRWNTKQTEVLVGYWKEHYDDLSSVNQRNYWREVAELVTQADRENPRVADDCKIKLKNMIGYYKKVRDRNNSTGEAAKFPKFYEDFESILATKDCIQLPELKQRGFLASTLVQKTSASHSDVGSDSSSLLSPFSPCSVGDSDEDVPLTSFPQTPLSDVEKAKGEKRSLDATDAEKSANYLDEIYAKKKKTDKQPRRKTTTNKFDELVELQKEQMKVMESTATSQRDFVAKMIEAQREQDEKERERQREMEERQQDKNRDFSWNSLKYSKMSNLNLKTLCLLTSSVI